MTNKLITDTWNDLDQSQNTESKKPDTRVDPVKFP